MRRAHSLVPAALLMLLVACNGPGANASASSGGGDQQSDSGTASASASASTDGGGGGGGSTDVDTVASNLAPPNGSEQARYSASGALIVSWTTSDSVDSLKSYYDGKLSSLGYSVLQTTDVQGTHGWVFGNADSTGVSGALTVGPATSGGGGAAVSLTVGTSAQ
jgi:hypothetical protein